MIITCSQTVLYCLINIYSNYAWVAPLKDEKDITTTNDFLKVLNESRHKPNKIWVDKCKFCNISIKYDYEIII